MAFDHSSLRWFEASTCMAAPRGLPSSPVQQDTVLCGFHKKPPSAPSWRTIISEPNQKTSPFHPWLNFPNKPVIQNIMKKNVAQQRRYHAMNTKGNFEYNRIIKHYRKIK
jgi:hypothetical protein